MNSTMPSTAGTNPGQDKTSQYVSIQEYSDLHVSDSYPGKANDRRKLRDTLERNNYFGVQTFMNPDKGRGKDAVSVLASDVPVLDKHLGEFFSSYGKSLKEIIDSHITSWIGNETSKEYLADFLKSQQPDRAPTPVVAEFIRTLTSLPDPSALKSEDLTQILSKKMSVGAKDLLIRFLNGFREKFDSRFDMIGKTRTEAAPVHAYTNAAYLAMARCIFNAEFIHGNRMIERALENHWYIEMWLFHAVFYTCGWRGNDICSKWKYLELEAKPEGFLGIDTSSLYDDLFYDRLPDELYEKVCEYATAAINASAVIPSKTSRYNPNLLTAFVSPELAPFYGLLTLISEAVHLRTGEGYMQENRAPAYQRKTLIREFYGMPMYNAIGRENMQIRRMNKDFLQGMESVARQNGAGSLLASEVASYARSHISLDTIAHYLNDHRMNGETAEMTLFFLLERGVFGFEIYQTLLTAFPDVMERLTLREQNELISMVDVSPYEIEKAQSEVLAKQTLRRLFLSPNAEANDQHIVTILKAMLEITQGRGCGKDCGTGCMLIASGEMCIHPEFDSCIANACQHLVFTRAGYTSILEVLKEYMDEANSGNRKAEAVLMRILFPRYRDILNKIMSEAGMNELERHGMKRLMEEFLA